MAACPKEGVVECRVYVKEPCNEVEEGRSLAEVESSLSHLQIKRDDLKVNSIIAGARELELDLKCEILEMQLTLLLDVIHKR